MGNRTGWIVAGALVVVIGGIVVLAAFPELRYWLGLEARPEVPTNIRAEMLERKDVGISVAEIVGAVPGAPGNAGEDYQKATDMVKANMTAMTDVRNALDANKEPEQAGVDALKQLDAVVAAGAAKAQMELTRMRGSRKFTCISTFKTASNLVDVAGALEALGDYYRKKKQYAEAERVLQHEFILGWHMMQERARVRMVQMGMGFQDSALGKLKELYQAMGAKEGDARLQTIERYSAGLGTMTDVFDRKAKWLWAGKPIPEDAFTILEKDKDRAWRVDALLVIARFKFPETDENPYRQRAIAALEKFANSPDPIEALAAQSGKELTKDEFARLGIVQEPD